METELLALKIRLGALGNDMAESMGGFLRCESCWHVKDIDGPSIAAGLTRGWPRCCGYTMRWWTQRQIDAGEVAR